MSQKIDGCREAFEKWFYSVAPHNAYFEQHEAGDYISQTVQLAWEGWEACLNTFQPQSPVKVLSVEDITKIMIKAHKLQWAESRVSVAPIGSYAQAVHAAIYGGKNE